MAAASSETPAKAQAAPSLAAADAAPSKPAVQADITVHDARKTFGVTRALDGCSFAARLGEIHAIVGGNGCGKSTLSKVISGVLPVDSGYVSVLGHAPTTPRDARLAGVATVFQEVLVADDCSVRDNLFVGVDGLFTRTKSAEEKYETAAAMMRELTGTDIDPDMLVGGLPLSVKQWITIGRALLCKPKVLILDESSAALDFDSTERLFVKMRQLRDQGSAILIVTHRIAELIRISDRATVMRDGRDVGVLEKSDITEKNLLGLMTGKSSSGAVHGTPAAASSGVTVMKTENLRIWPNGPRVEFGLRYGEIVGVAGLDGQGQNEFVRVLAGVQEAEEGLALARNGASDFQPINGLADADRLRVAYVSGDRKREGIFANLSIFENLALPLAAKTPRVPLIDIIDWPSLSSVFDSMVEKLSIKYGFRSDKITSLSGGNQQKVLIGRAFALRPRILVLNDPARGIDVEAKRELYRHLRDFAAQGNAVVFMSSELEEFIGLCTRVLVFRHGGLFETFTSDEIHPDRILESMFGHSQHAGQAAKGAGPLGQPRKGDAAPEEARKRAPAAALPEPRSVRIVDFSAPKPSPPPDASSGQGRQIKIRFFNS
jgi:ribose transport system ATP-binding protein